VPFAVGVSEHPVPALAIGEAVGQVLDGGGTGPDVLFVFADLALSGALDDIVVTLHRLLRPVVLVGATAPAVLAHARTLRRKRGLALLAGYGFVATASRTVDGLDGAEPALTLVEPGGHHLLLDHDVYDLGTVHVAIDGVDVEHVHLRDSEDLRGRHFDGALLFGRGRVRYDEELTLRLDAPVVGMTASGPVGPAPLPTIVLFGDAG